jgi:hypothetical protein
MQSPSLLRSEGKSLRCLMYIYVHPRFFFPTTSIPLYVRERGGGGGIEVEWEKPRGSPARVSPTQARGANSDPSNKCVPFASCKLG